jgi:hypothetical protein
VLGHGAVRSSRNLHCNEFGEFIVDYTENGSKVTRTPKKAGMIRRRIATFNKWVNMKLPQNKMRPGSAPQQPGVSARAG